MKGDHLMGTVQSGLNNGDNLCVQLKRRFVPRPFPFLQFLITCSMLKRRGKAWKNESCAWHQVDMRGVVPDCFVTHKPCIDQPRIYRIMSCNNAVFQTLQCGQDITRRTSRFFVGHICPPPPSCLPSRLPDVMHVTHSSRPSPSVFAYCKWSKTGGSNGLGTRITFPRLDIRLSRHLLGSQSSNVLSSQTFPPPALSFLGSFFFLGGFVGIGKLSKLTAAASVPAERERERERDGSYPNLSFIPRPHPLTKRNGLVKQRSKILQTTGSKKVRILEWRQQILML